MKRSATILLVEDESALLTGIADLLQLASLPYEVRVLTAANGQAGLRLMQEETPDLIISDIMMPRMDGYEFLAEVRRRPSWVHIPFIFLTAKAKRDDLLQGRRMGAELYITKPFATAELLELVESQLDRTFELRRVREEKLAALKRDILQLLSHEFRTPLTYVTAYYEMLADSLTDFQETDHLEEYLRGIQAGSLRLSRLVQDLIRVMEIRTGEAAQAFASQATVIEDVGDLLYQAGKGWEQMAAAKGLVITYKVAPDLPPVWGQRQSLLEVLDHLIDNAVKFMRPGSDHLQEICLKAKVRDGRVVLVVQDYGIGFPEYVQEQLFELFYQYDRGRMEQQGAGVGLAIVKGLVDLHQGQIQVRSEEGEGSRFEVWLPAYDAARWNPGRGQGGAGTGKAATILIVEDDPFLLTGLKELLEVHQSKYQLEVLIAGNGRDGLRVLERHRPDLIISDVMMPVMDGYEFLRQVRQQTDLLQIPFIFLTARGELSDIHQGLRSGVEQYIPKPYDVDELMQLVATQLDRHFQVESVVSQNFEALKREILGLLRPDFLTPLEMVTQQSQRLVHGLEAVQNDADLKLSLHSIRTASEQLTRLVEDLIALAELQTGEAEMIHQVRAARVSPADLSGLLMSVSYAVQMRGSLANVAFAYRVPPGLPSLYCDLEGVAQCLSRLYEIVLSLFGRQPAGQMVLLAETRPGELHLSVLAEQVWFPEEVASIIIPYCQQEQPQILDRVEFGPSLMVVKGIMRLHGGQVIARNDPQAGASLSLVFPLVADDG